MDRRKMRWKFKETYTLEQRKSESKYIREKYPERIPVIVQKDPKASTVSTLEKQKYLVPQELSMGEFMWIIRNRMKLSPEKSIYLFVGRVLPLSSSNLGMIYSLYKDEDGFLYIAYSDENTFGSKT